MIEFGFVRLSLREVPIIKVPTILQVQVSKCDNAATLVPHRQILPSLVESDGSEDVRICDILFVALPQSINVNPVCVILSLTRV